jgi:hypothetical protein
MFFIKISGFRNFANKTFANYWRKSRGYTGESSVDIRQLAKVQSVYWRISREWIGESRIELHEWRWHIHILSNVQELCLTLVTQPGGRQMGNCPFHLEICPSKFLSGRSCPLKFYFFKIVFLIFRWDSNCIFCLWSESHMHSSCKKKVTKNHFKINFW